MGYSVKLSKSVLKDLKKLKATHLDEKFLELMDVLKLNPFQNLPPYEKNSCGFKWKTFSKIEYPASPRIFCRFKHTRSNDLDRIIV